MIGVGYLRHALGTAARVARFDTNAIAEFDHSFEGFFRSFFAAVLCLPLYVLVVAGERRLTEDITATVPGRAFVPLPPPDATYLAVEAAAYLLNWLALPLAMIAIVPMLGASRRYVPYIVAYNWGSCIVFAVTLLPYLAYAAGLASLTGMVILYYAVTVFVVTYRWRLARYGLQIPGITAAGIVIIDLLVSILIALGTARIHRSLS